MKTVLTVKDTLINVHNVTHARVAKTSDPKYPNWHPQTWTLYVYFLGSDDPVEFLCDGLEPEQEARSLLMHLEHAIENLGNQP